MLGNYAKLFVALGSAGEVFVLTQWPNGMYTQAIIAGIGALLVGLVPNAGKGKSFIKEDE